jgi:hypothetical protein
MNRLLGTLPPFVVNILKRVKKVLTQSLRKSFEICGLNVARKNDYYSPLPVTSQLNKNIRRWRGPSDLTGVEYDIAAFKQTLSKLLARYGEFSQYPPYSRVQSLGYGQGYTALDAFVLYAMVREYKPERYIEIGSGVSTYYCNLAAQANRQEGFPLQIHCVEPYPYEMLYSIPHIRIHAREAQDLDVQFFRELEEGDVLFIDSSHVLKIDSDVAFLYLEVLPNLNKGVLIHIHDIPFPYNIPYPPELWIFGKDWPMLWNEAMLLQAFLCFNSKFRIILSLPLLRHVDEDFLRRNIPGYESVEQNPNTFSSIWLQKVG